MDIWLIYGTYIAVFLGGAAVGSVGMGLYCLHLITKDAEDAMKATIDHLKKLNGTDGENWKNDKPSSMTDEDWRKLLGE